MRDLTDARFDPLPRVLALDDFDQGHSGWSKLVGNYENDLDTMLPGYAQITSPMLSNLAHWDGGSHGSMDGGYALKVATRPRSGAVSVALKRMTYRKPCPIRLEFYAAFKPEADEMLLMADAVKSFGFLFDVQSGDRTPDPERAMPHVRYLNCADGERHQKWQYKNRMPDFHDIGDDMTTVSVFHLEDRDWIDVADGAQRLCYNEIATKVNWHYVRFDFDLRTMTGTRLQCNDRVFDLAGFSPIRVPAMSNLWCMLNLCVFVETCADKRAFLYLDSVCLSGDL